MRPDSLSKAGMRSSSEEGASPLSDLLLRMIWKLRRVSRADLSRHADISRSTVSDLVKDLLQTGLVAESGSGQSRGGRRPIVLEFQDEAFGILGVDIGAAEYIHDRLLAQRKNGAAILLISEDLDEVMQLSDRIIVLLEGEVMGELPREQFDVNAIGLLMSGVTTASPSST